MNIESTDWAKRFQQDSKENVKMAACYPLGRLGTELRQLPFDVLDMLVKHCPDEDPWLRGESLEVIITRMAFLSGRDVLEVKKEVTHTLKEKHEKAESLKHAESQISMRRYSVYFPAMNQDILAELKEIKRRVDGLIIAFETLEPINPQSATP